LLISRELDPPMNLTILEFSGYYLESVGWNGREKPKLAEITVVREIIRKAVQRCQANGRRTIIKEDF